MLEQRRQAGPDGELVVNAVAFGAKGGRVVRGEPDVGAFQRPAVAQAGPQLSRCWWQSALSQLNTQVANMPG
jgi:hypothetical protein